MSNYKSNDNSTENTSLREWWGTVKSEMSRIFEILNGLETIVSITKNEVDDCTDVGLYHVVNGEDEIGESEYYIFVSEYSGVLGMPEIRQFKIDDKVYARTKVSAAEWSEWKNISNYPMSLVEGTEMEVEKGTFVQAKEGATIIGDLRERTFDENGVPQRGAVATGLYSLAAGQGATASEDFSFVIGAQSGVKGYGAGAVGGGNTVNGYGSVVVGLMNRASADYAYIVGQNNEITARGGVIVGQNSKVRGEWGTAISYAAEADGEFSVAIGEKAHTLGDKAVVVGGYGNKALSECAVVIGGNNNVAGSKGFKVLLQEEVSSSGSVTEKHTFNGGTQSIDITIKEGETQHIFKSSVSTLGGTGGLAFYDNVTCSYVYVNTFPTVVDVTDAKFANGYTIYSDNCNTEEDITFELERVSGSTSKTYDFPYFQHEGAGFGTSFMNGGLGEMGLEVGMKCTLTVGGVTATGVVIDAINYDSISITFSAVPQDFPSDAGGTLTVGEESPPKIVYTLDSVDGIEVGMAYSLVNPSGESKYNAGTITEIAEDKVTVDDDGSINAKGCFMAIIGHPELGTQDIGINSFAVGNGTVALSENQVVRGRFNEEDSVNKYADIVGNGTSDADRSNAYTLDWDGNGTFAGDVTIQGKISVSSIFGMKPKSETVKCHIGDAIPTGDIVKCVRVVAPKAITSVSIFCNNYSSFFAVGDVINQTLMGNKINEIGGFTDDDAYVPWACNSYDEDCYAIFEVASEDKEPCLCLTSPDGSKFALEVGDDGKLSTTKLN